RRSSPCSVRSWIVSSYRHPTVLRPVPTRRSSDLRLQHAAAALAAAGLGHGHTPALVPHDAEAHAEPRHAAFREHGPARADDLRRSEEHTSELQSRENLVCRLLHVKKKDELDGTPR